MSIYSVAAVGKHRQYATGVTSTCFCILAQFHDCMLDHPFLHNSLEHKMSTAYQDDKYHPAVIHSNLCVLTEHVVHLPLV